MVALAEDEPLPADRASAPTGFDLFVLLLSIVSLLNIVLAVLLRREDIVNVVLVVDGVLSVVFLGDFLLRLHRAPSKRGYFIGGLGWLDLLGSLPFPGLRLARIFRVVRVGRDVRHYGLRNLVGAAAQDRAGNALLAAIFLTIVVLQYGSMAILRVEDEAEGANIHTASDALWWSYVTITTVGYGDRFPVTNTGRIIGVVVLSIGVGLFGVLTGFLANLFLAPKQRTSQAPADDATDQPLELDELRRLIAELREATAGGAVAVVNAAGNEAAVPSPSPAPSPDDERT
jgi:voltage-gated potassium channel